MTVLNQADNIYLGGTAVNAVYYGTTKVWPSSVSISGVLTAIEAQDTAGITAIDFTTTWEAASVASVTLSGGNLTATNTGTTSQNQGAKVASASGRNTGKYYFEATWSAHVGGVDFGAGVGTYASTYTGMGFTGGVTGIMAYQTGGIWAAGSNVLSWSEWGSGVVMGVAIDLDNRKAWFHFAPGGIWNNSGTANPATNVGGLTIPAGTMLPFVTFGGVGGVAGNVLIANFGATAFSGTVPSGFTAGWPASYAAITGTLTATEAVDIAAVTGTVASAPAIAHRSTSQSSFTFGSSPNAAAAPAGLANNDIMIATMAIKASLAVVPSPPAGWTAIDNTSVVGPSGGNTVTHYAWWKRAASESGSYSFTFSGVTTSQICISAYSGCTTSGSPIDVYSKASVTDPTTLGITVTAASVTTTVPDTMLVLASHSFNPSTNTVPSGMTERLDGTFLYRADEARASTGATGTRTYTSGNTSAEPWSAFLIALKP